MRNKKWLIALMLVFCITVSLFVGLRFASAQNAIEVRVAPADIVTTVCEYFDVYIAISNPLEIDIYDYDILLGYNSTQMTPTHATDGGYLHPTVDFNWEDLGDAVHVWAKTSDGGQNAIVGTLTIITFHCDAVGVSPLTLEAVLSDSGGGSIFPDFVVGGSVTQQPPPAPAWIDPPDYTVPICIPFPVYVMVDIPLGYDLVSFNLFLEYDTTYVDCIDIAPGDFPPLPVSIDNKIINDLDGQIEFDVSTLAGIGSTGTGSIAKVTFHCTGAGSSSLVIASLTLTTSQGWQIPYVETAGSMVQVAYWEPLKLQHLVELPYTYHMTDMPFVPPSSAEGFAEVKAELEAKGYEFDAAIGGGLYHIDSFFDVYFEPGSEPFNGTVASWWSSNLLEDGTRACLLSAEMSDGSSMAMGFVTNLLPPDQIPEVDPYIIYNAEPYFFIDFYWWAWTPVGKVVHFYYWWHNSHNHPNWFWGPYWWWRCYVKAYYYPYTVVPYWRPWWSWWWHWVYWRHWYWWSSYFPYDP